MSSSTPWVARCSSRRCDRSGREGGKWLISSKGEARVSFNLIDFYHNSSRLLGIDSYDLTARQVGEISAELRRGFETGALKPPSIEVIPFEKGVDDTAG